jgi:hypothetical protein
MVIPARPRRRSATHAPPIARALLDFVRRRQAA